MNFDKHTELQLLEALEEEPETSQADLAAQVGVAVGTVNWYLKRWSKKGFVIINRMDRWRWRYLLTPQGVAEKTQLAKEYFEASMSIYRRTRAEARRLLGEVNKAGYSEVVICGEGDIVDICQLTCLELGLSYEITSDELETKSNSKPLLTIEGTDMVIVWPVLESTNNPKVVEPSAVVEADLSVESQ